MEGTESRGFASGKLNSKERAKRLRLSGGSIPPRGPEMLVNIVEMSPVKRGKEPEFKEWFEWSNGVFEKADGSISRRLLVAADRKGNYVAIVEHESEETFRAMQASEDREQVSRRVEPLLDGRPTPRFYKVVVSTPARS